MTDTDDIVLKPAVSYAFLKVLPLIFLAQTFLSLAWYLSPCFILFSFVACLAAGYRLLYIRSLQYLISKEYIRLTEGLLFKRIDYLEMYRVKDYIIKQSLSLQLLRLIHLTLKSTDLENPTITLTGIPDSEITNRIRERVQQARRKNNIYEIN
jgi:uncharacterized membrane protein YdbT with pleckstrin-like domain